MKVLDFDGCEFLSMDEIEFADTPRTVTRRVLRRSKKAWWDNEDAPRRFRRPKVRRPRVDRRLWEPIDDEE